MWVYTKKQNDIFKFLISRSSRVFKLKQILNSRFFLSLGNASETCYTKYGAISLKSKCCHEIGLRIVLQCIEANANKYGRYTVSFLIKHIHDDANLRAIYVFF